MQEPESSEGSSEAGTGETPSLDTAGDAGAPEMGQPPAGPLEVVSVSPAARSLVAEPDAAIVVEFDRALDPASVHSAKCVGLRALERTGQGRGVFFFG